MTPLLAESFSRDPRLKQAKDLVLAALDEHQRSLTGVRPPDPARQVSFDKLLNDFATCRGGKLYFPFVGSGFGRGPLVELLDGSVKYDFISGIGVHCLGHSHPALIESALEAAYSDTVMQGNLQQNADVFELSKELLQASGLDHCFLTTSGAMANENALKLALQKNHPASRLLAFDHCFAGRTWILSQITDKPAFREGLPLNIDVDYVPHFDTLRPQESTERSLAALNQHCARYPNKHAAMLFELVQGEGGFYGGTHEFFATLMRRCRELNIAVIADEIQTFGRTSNLFAYQHFNLTEFIDIATVGKLLQVCCTLFRKSYQPKAGLLTQTFTGGTAALRAGQAILRNLQTGNYFGPKGRIAEIERHCHARLHQMSERHPHLIRGPFGVGAMVAFTPLDGHPDVVARYLQALFEAGVIAFSAGAHPARVRLLLPFGVVTPQDLDAAFDIIEQTLVKFSKQ